MSLLKWMTLGTTTAPKQPPPAPLTPPASPVPENPTLATARWDHKRFGMENFGNTCYANSVLQALYFCDPFRQLVCDAPDRSYPTTPEAIAAAHAAVAQLQPPIQPRPKPQHARRPSSAGDPYHTTFAAGGAAAFAASALMHPPGGHTPHKAANTPPAPIVNVGPVIPPLPPSLFSALRSLFIHIAANPADKGTVSPRAFVEKLKKENELFRSNMHQDAHEFLNYLLNSIVEDLTLEMKAGPIDDLSKSIASTASSTARSPHLTLVHDLFEGTLTSETRCLTCETVSSRDESFLDLSIDIERNSSITACLRQFSASEMLCQKNKFFCDSCCGLQEAEKRMKIKKLPNVLALHLKRFKYQEDVQRYIKLSYRVAFPFELRLFNTVDDAQDPDRLYELFAIVVHVGSGPHHGHYITIAKQRGQWLLFDDDIVEPIRENEIPKYFGDSPAGSGYVLFYQAVNIDLQALGVSSAQPSAQASAQPSVQVAAASMESGAPRAVPPVVVEAPESPTTAVMPEATRVSPPVSESGTIGTPSTPTLSHPSSSPVLSKPEGLPPSTAPSSNGASGFRRQASTKLSLGSSGSVLAPEAGLALNGHANGDALHENGIKAESATRTGRTRGLSANWFGWAGKKKDKGTPGSSRKATLDDSHHPLGPVIDIRRPSAPAMMETSSPVLAPENGGPVIHDEPEQAGGLGVDLGRTADEPQSASVSASSSGDHLLQSVPGLDRHPVTARSSPPRVSRSGSISATTIATTNGSARSGLHVPSPSRPSPSSSASSVSTPLKHKPSAPKLAPFPLTMSPVKEKQRPSTGSSANGGVEPPMPTFPPPPSLPSPALSPIGPPARANTIGFAGPPQPAPPVTKIKTAKRKLSFSNALGSFARSRDKSVTRIDQRKSIAEVVEALPVPIPTTPTTAKRK